LEGQILRYYLKVFSVSIFIFFVLFFSYLIFIVNKKIDIKNNIIEISKGENLDSIYIKNFHNFKKLDIYAINIYYRLNKLLLNKFIHFGHFYIDENISSYNLLKIITKPSNILNKITIIEGWSKIELQKELLNHFEDVYQIPYEDIIADTYFYKKNSDFKSFVDSLTDTKNKYFKKLNQNKLFKLLSQEEIIILGSLIEKEGLGIEDKRKISSVILNRLNKNMKLQIDATVIFAITNGKYDLKRKLLKSDLKFDDEYNTYKYKGLPPKPISYVGRKTLDIIFENYQTDFLFYFFNKSLNSHIFSRNYEEHRDKLNEYRNSE
tara:strand:+ start:2784 stop:3746 length:963 start_codon:yes stop_codon:yes gene_type:complete